MPVPAVDQTFTFSSQDTDEIDVPDHQEGDLLVALITTNGASGTPSPDQSGWTEIDSHGIGTGSDAVRAIAWYRFATNSEPSTYLFTHSGARVVSGMQSWRDVHPSEPIGDVLTRGLTSGDLEIGTLDGTSDDGASSAIVLDDNTGVDRPAGWNIQNEPVFSNSSHGVSYDSPSPNYDVVWQKEDTGDPAWAGIAFVIRFGIPDEPTDFTLTTIDEDSAESDWTENDAANTLRYDVQWDTSSSFSDPTLLTDVGDPPQTIDGLPASSSPETIWARVRACNLLGCSDWSTADSTTLDPIPTQTIDIETDLVLDADVTTNTTVTSELTSDLVLDAEATGGVVEAEIDILSDLVLDAEAVADSPAEAFAWVDPPANSTVEETVTLVTETSDSRVVAVRYRVGATVIGQTGPGPSGGGS